MHNIESTFLNHACSIYDQVCLCTAVVELQPKYAMLEGDNFVLVYLKVGNTVLHIWRIPKEIFTEFNSVIDSLTFTTMTVPPQRINGDVLYANIWKPWERDHISLKDACKAYHGDTLITKLYENEKEAVYVYKENYVRENDYVGFEVINFEDQNNKNSCRIPWTVYKAIVEILDRR